jgi:molybdate transport system substrate-binding protein
VGNPVEHVDIPAAQNTIAIYAGGVMKGAARVEAARKWLAVLESPEAVRIFESYGFKAYQ